MWRSGRVSLLNFLVTFKLPQRYQQLAQQHCRRDALLGGFGAQTILPRPASEFPGCVMELEIALTDGTSCHGTAAAVSILEGEIGSLSKHDVNESENVI